MESVAPEAAVPAEGVDPEWAGLLEYLHVARGFDFHGYKSGSLTRRIRKRMHALGIESYVAYQEHIEGHEAEFRELFNTILINVTSFFRDLEAWDALRGTALTQILGSPSSLQPIRVWSAGCASGEEAYSIAMVLAEELGVDQVRERVKIYATDVDEEALNVARHAAYREKQIENVPPELRDKYFEHVDGVYSFRKDLRRQVIFGRHDLVTDAPISRVDLLTCRNTLMYFNAETQAQILNRFHFALNDGGFLFLGRAETLMAHGQIFVPADLKRRISRKRARPPSRGGGLDSNSRTDDRKTTELQSSLISAALELSPVAQLVLDAEGRVVGVSERSRQLFGLQPTDVGRPLRDLQVSYRPVELRSVIDRVTADGRPVSLKEVEWRSPLGEVRWLDVHVAALENDAGRCFGIAVTFSDVTGQRRMQRELEQSHRELETAYEELQSTNEELETTNEELQSTIEELETTNEELQSTNEELETMNEELQSANEELATINDEARQRGEAVSHANGFLQSVLAGLHSGVVVVDGELRILAWSRQAEELWGVRASEVTGQHLLNLDIGLPVEELGPVIRRIQKADGAREQITVNAVNRRGKPFRCLVTGSPLADDDGAITGAILLMEHGRGGEQPT